MHTEMNMEIEREEGHARGAERCPLAVEITLESEHNFYAGITDNISEGGVFVATYTPPPRGTIVWFELSLPGCDKSWTLAGEVRWIREVTAACEGMPPGCGLQFRELPADCLRAIRAFVAGRETLFFEAA